MENKLIDPKQFFQVEKEDIRSYRLTDGSFVNLGLGIPRDCVELYKNGFPYLKLKKGAEILFEKLSENDVLKLINNTTSKMDVSVLSKLITSEKGKAIVATKRKQLLK